MTSTLYEPAASLYAMIPSLTQRPGVLDVSLFIGYGTYHYYGVA
jgi:microcystin degradation protein MlrC